ncbi:MAG: prephenate dehydratase [Candidatus Tectomicrobia bacterium]|uniref:Prephenate dehydratase n=1 Tax=Tectimicrobiota bacterium TaxID=2528274 RepID=A0A932G1U7_UNCTE|nr:prephenate dehydratase [Candidatus Tectomicrobia bacterium]
MDREPSIGRPRVSFQGERGAYSEDAAYKFFGPEIEVIPCETFSELFDKVREGQADFGISPVENSTAGTIVQTYDLLLESDLHVVGEAKLRIVHCLISFPGTTLEAIKKIYAHPQAYAQCLTFCRQFPSWRHIPTYDTAGSVKIIREEGLRDAAAIASSRAAEIYDMEVLRHGIESHPNNVTRFFIVSREASHSNESNKSSLVFAARHQAGALYECLGELASRKINLTKLESRPRPNRPWEYVFYLDFEGNLEEEKCVQAVTGLLKRAAFVKILGSYRAAED